MDETTIAYVALTTGLTELLKGVVQGYVSERFYPLFAMLIALVLTMMSGESFMTGVVVGLSANGLYSGVKRTFIK